jgi:hypothetical protein
VKTSIPVVWTNDDILFGRTAELGRCLQFLDGLDIPGVFFVIPHNEAGDLDQDAELISLMKAAEKRGHEFHQHGFQHTPFECGIPDLEMLEVDRGAFEYFNAHREALEKIHTFEAQIEMLQKGREIWRCALGRDSVGFRPGWGAFCGNFYRALSTLGFTWVSSRINGMTSWHWNCERWETPFRFREGISISPRRLPEGIWEYPMAGDYAFRVPNEPKRIDAMVELALKEFDYFFERGEPMLIVSHWHGLQHLDSTGYAVHEKLIPRLKKTGRAEFMGMAELTSRYQGKSCASH